MISKGLTGANLLKFRKIYQNLSKFITFYKNLTIYDFQWTWGQEKPYRPILNLYDFLRSDTINSGP
jgi:hypothetical protein